MYIKRSIIIGQQQQQQQVFIVRLRFILHFYFWTMCYISK